MGTQLLARWLKARGIEAHVIHASSVAVSREHRRAKTDRLDTELLKRTFVGWLRGERDHCKTAGIPSLREEDAKRPSRERESLVGEQSRLVNRMKATLIRLGIRGFNPKLRHAEQRLEALRTPEGEPIPPNTLTELKRDMQRRRFICDQIRSIEQERLERLERTPDTEPHAMVRLLARVTGIGIETADLLVHELLLRNMRDRRAVARYKGRLPHPQSSRASLPWHSTGWRPPFQKQRSGAMYLGYGKHNHNLHCPLFPLRFELPAPPLLSHGSLDPTLDYFSARHPFPFQSRPSPHRLPRSHQRLRTTVIHDSPPPPSPPITRGFSDAGMREAARRGGGRRRRSAKARSRGR